MAIVDTCGDGIGAPAVRGFAVTPSDSTNFDFMVRALYVGGAGNIVVVLPDDTALTFSGVTAGSFLPVRAKRVNSTNTTATLILGLY
jgi:hypothetical protein